MTYSLYEGYCPRLATSVYIVLRCATVIPCIVSVLYTRVDRSLRVLLHSACFRLVFSLYSAHVDMLLRRTDPTRAAFPKVFELWRDAASESAEGVLPCCRTCGAGVRIRSRGLPHRASAWRKIHFLLLDFSASQSTMPQRKTQGHKRWHSQLIHYFNATTNKLEGGRVVNVKRVCSFVSFLAGLVDCACWNVQENEYVSICPTFRTT